ncbi:MAG: thiolase domain-containing protein [Chloroflexi bacterium]|nr:thiolase domain-containing protein [Chloroflexota bacterium]
MRDVYILGIGQTDVGEHWETSLRHLALEAVEAALKDANIKYPDAMYVGNMLAPQLSNQSHLGALIADFCGLRGIEAVTVEAGNASGAAALRQAYIAVASGLIDSAIALGVEKITDTVGSGVNAALATMTDSDWEASHGATPTTIAALIMRRYMHEYGVTLRDFAGFSVNAHANAKTNPKAMFRNVITPDAFAKAGMICDPINMFDSAPDADGAAAVILIGADTARAHGADDVRAHGTDTVRAHGADTVRAHGADTVRAHGADTVRAHGADTVRAHGRAPLHPLVRIAGSAVVTDAMAVHDRPDPLIFKSAKESAEKAFAQAGIGVEDLNVIELHDAYTVFAALSLEALGVSERGKGWESAQNGGISLKGKTPISTFGGLKARGNPGGATGLYQVAEVAMQLRGEAGANQIANAKRGLTQSLASSGATAVTHILERVE